MKILVLNGSPQGARGNCASVVRKLQKIKNVAAVKTQFLPVHLESTPYSESLAAELKSADAVIFLTGTYWDSWGSPLQVFLEKATELEADPLLVGKPAAVVVLMHSVGGKSVLSRLQGVLSTFGFLLPPFSGMVHSLAGQVATGAKGPHQEDFWSLSDLEVIVENLVMAAGIKSKWKAWPVDRKNVRKIWVK